MEVYAAINADLTSGGFTAATNVPTFVTKDTALRARMAAYRQDYTSAATFCSTIVS
jgi:hypothetical protein